MLHKKIKKVIIALWILGITSILGAYVLYPEIFTPEKIQTLFGVNTYTGLFLYFVLGTLRGFTLIPSTVLILGGLLIFPPIPFFIVNLLCVFTSSSIVFYWGKFLGFDEYFHRKYPTQVQKLQKALSHKELPFITLWGFFPLVPTDMICYICEALEIKLWKCLTGVAIGEATISAIYIFGGTTVLANI